MAVAFDAVSSSAIVTTISVSWTHTPVGTPTGVIVDMVTDVGVTHNSVTYGGVAMTQIGASVTNNVIISQWKLGSPPGGSQTVTATQSASPNEIHCFAITVVGSATTTAGLVGAQFTNTGNSATPSVIVTSAAGELVIDNVALANGVGPAMTATGATETSRGSVVGTSDSEAVGTAPGAASVTMSWSTNNGDFWAMSAVSVKATPAGTFFNWGNDDEAGQSQNFGVAFSAISEDDYSFVATFPVVTIFPTPGGDQTFGFVDPTYRYIEIIE